MNTFLERCYAQSNRLSRPLRDISVLTRMDEAANMSDMERVDISLLVGNIINEVASVSYTHLHFLVEVTDFELGKDLLGFLFIFPCLLLVHTHQKLIPVSYTHLFSTIP